MKITSLILLVSGLLLTLYGVNAMGEPGRDLLSFFSSVTAATQILPLGVGIVMVVVSIAGMLPDSEDMVRRKRSVSEGRTNTAD